MGVTVTDKQTNQYKSKGSQVTTNSKIYTVFRFDDHQMCLPNIFKKYSQQYL